ncbi:unnamed protein product [Polarella glacialis]|uniref:S-adenosyl-L-homocysteine hydrolase NAD binding domain-containing protein n=1 Tax=Polarella glacialis TaxID=89957 RepID=A0A813EAR6_POLGL|nr:unnamed protein product [Polarella glacialis]
MRGVDDYVLGIEIDPINASQVCIEGFQVVTVEDCIHDIDIFISAAGNSEIIAFEYTKKMKNNSIDCDIGHFDKEIDIEDLEPFPGITDENIRPQVNWFVFSGSGNGGNVLALGRLVNFGAL